MSVTVGLRWVWIRVGLRWVRVGLRWVWIRVGLRWVTVGLRWVWIRVRVRVGTALTASRLALKMSSNTAATALRPNWLAMRSAPVKGRGGGVKVEGGC